MNHEWPTAVHKTMIAVDKVTPDAPDLSLITLRRMPQRRPAVFTVAVAVLGVLATVGGLAYLLGRDQRDTTPPAATGGQTTVPTSAQQNKACALLSDPPLSPAEQASMIDRLLTSDPAALDPAEVQKCKAATMVQLRRLQAMVLERQAALHASSTSRLSPTSELPTGPSVTSGTFDFAPLALLQPPDGYTFASARFDPTEQPRIGLVRYHGPQGTPDLSVILRPGTDWLATPLQNSARQRWTVDGRDVIDDTPLGHGCEPDACSVGLQWDPQTQVSITWWANQGGTLGPANTQEALVALVQQLTPIDAQTFVPGALL